jgi:hypothetical protein
MKKDNIKLLGKHFPSESDIRNGKLTPSVLEELNKHIEQYYENANKYAQFADKCLPKKEKNDKIRKKVDGIFDKIVKELKQVQNVVSKVDNGAKNVNIVEPILDPLMVYKDKIVDNVLNNGKKLRSNYDQLLDVYDKYDEEFDHLLDINSMYQIVVKLYDEQKSIETNLEMMRKEKREDSKRMMKKDAVTKLKNAKKEQIKLLEDEIDSYGKNLKLIMGMEEKIVTEFGDCIFNIIRKELKELKEELDQKSVM